MAASHLLAMLREERCGIGKWTRRLPLVRLRHRKASNEHPPHRSELPGEPNYPKMPGEPKRVQPSKDRDLKGS